MAYLLDVLGSTIISAFVILMIVNFNIQLNTFSSGMLSSSITQGDAVVSGQILEYDLYKIGYKVVSAKIKSADSSSITYYTDLQNTGTVDSVTYYTGNINALSSTTNPNDKPLYRKQNTQSPIKIADVTGFNISYFDSSGTKIAFPSTPQLRSKIRTLNVAIRFEAQEPTDGFYQGVDWERTIRPKNLMN